VRLRTVLSLVNLVAIVAAFLVLFEFPQYADLAFYVLVAWIFVGFALMYFPGAGRVVAGASSPSLAGTFPNAASSTLASSSAPSEARPLDFCIWCGTVLPNGSSVCPACGRRVASV
jgi:hypothetical protein